MPMRFHDRHDAGRKLAPLLSEYADRNDVRVLAIPRGGVPVAAEVARYLRAPLDVFIVRKLGAPGFPEYAFGAIASGGLRVLDPGALERLGLHTDVIERVSAAEALELARREREYRTERPPVDLGGCTAVVVDDGLATGATMRAALRALRGARPAAASRSETTPGPGTTSGAPARLVLAVPVAPPEVLAALAAEADRVVAVLTPEPFCSVGQWYEEFDPVSDGEVQALLAAAEGAHV